MGTTPAPRKGRPPAATGSEGLEATSKWPRLTISVRPKTQATLGALATLTGKTPWLLVEESVNGYVNSLPDRDRELVTSIVERKMEDSAVAPKRTRKRSS